MHADEVVFVIRARGWDSSVVYGATGGVVYFSAGVGALCVVGEELGDGVFVV